MRKFCELIFLLLPWLTHTLESSTFYRPNSFSTMVGPTHYFHRDTPFVPSTFNSDMQLEESKRRITPQRHSSKKLSLKPFSWDDDEFSNERFNSAEFSEEANTAFESNENDSREYSIGTQIRVQHPITEPKKYTTKHIKPSTIKSSSHGAFKSATYSDYHPIKDLRSELPSAPSKPRANKLTQFYDPADSIKIVSPPKSSSTSSYNVFEADQDDYEPPSRPSKAHASFDRFKGVPSKKQVEAYLEDQQKMLDKALKIQLMNDPRFQQYVKAKEKERLEGDAFESEEIQLANPPQPSFRQNNARRRPQVSEFKRPLKGKPQIKSKGKPLPRRFRSAIVISV